MESNKITVAIVDDHKEMRSAIIDYLRELGFDVILEARHGADMLQQLAAAAELPQICLLDYTMPGMKGDALAKHMRQRFPSVKLAAMTTNMTTHCLLAMLGNGCTGYLIKSSNPTEWKKGIEEIISKGFYFTEWMQKTLLDYIHVNYAAFSKYL